MAPGDESGFASGVHLGVKNHVTTDVLEADKGAPGRDVVKGDIVTNLPGHGDLGKFLLYRRFPVVVVVFLVELQGFFNGVWEANTKFVCRAPTFLLGFGDDAAAMAHDLGNPPQECWFTVEEVGNGAFGDFDGVRFF